MSTEFNRELWEEKFTNIFAVIDTIKDDLVDVKTTLKMLIKLSFTAIIAVCGWSLIQLYSNLSHPTNANPLPAYVSRLSK